MVEYRNHTPKVVGSSPSFVISKIYIGVWRSGSVSVLGIEGRVFKSYHSEIFMLIFFHFFFNFLIIVSALFVFLCENSVHSVLFLILTFLNASAICFVFGADFLGLLLIIIYVGAIAILFLFVIMMLNIKVKFLGIFKYLPLVFLISLIICSQVFLYIESLISSFNFTYYYINTFESLSSDVFLSQILFNYFLPCFLIAGIILLVGMIGAIILTLNFSKKKKHELSFRQLSRSNNILFF